MWHVGNSPATACLYGLAEHRWLLQSLCLISSPSADHHTGFLFSTVPTADVSCVACCITCCQARNILLKSSGGGADRRHFVAKVADFGLSMRIDPEATHVSNIYQVGAPGQSSWGGSSQ
jgi:hypothetical protein